MSECHDMPAAEGRHGGFDSWTQERVPPRTGPLTGENRAESLMPAQRKEGAELRDFLGRERDTDRVVGVWRIERFTRWSPGGRDAQRSAIGVPEGFP
jgi:hypothetical protein